MKKILTIVVCLVILALGFWQLREAIKEEEFFAVFGFWPHTKEYADIYLDEDIVKAKIVDLELAAKDLNSAYFRKYGYYADAGHPEWYKNQFWMDAKVRLIALAAIRQYEAANKLRKHFGYLPKRE